MADFSQAMADLQGKLLDMREGDEEPQTGEGYSIEAAGDPEAQGRRAMHHLQRIRQASEIAGAQRGALKWRIEDAQRKVREAEHLLAQVNRWLLEATEVDRRLIADWREHARMWNDPKQPRRKTADFGGVTLGSHTVTRREAIDFVPTEEAGKWLMDALPDAVTFKLAVGEAKKRLTIAGDAVVITATGETVPPDVAQVRVTEQREELFVQIGEDKIDLREVWHDDSSSERDEPDDGAGRADERERDGDDEDPFGDTDVDGARPADSGGGGEVIDHHQTEDE